jgi:CheY-like chemotaxis protein
MGIFDKIKKLFGQAEAPLPAPANRHDITGETPLVPASAVPSAPSGNERRVKSRVNARPGTRILVVDDSATIVALLSRMLRQNEYIVLEAADAEAGLEIAKRELPDLVFLDIVLPGMDGFAALRQLRRDPYTRDIPVIMISGNEQATEQFYVHRIGADDFMKKPFSRPEVFARIERLLDATRIPRRFSQLPPKVDEHDDESTPA